METICKEVCGDHALVVFKLDEQKAKLSEIHNDTRITREILQTLVSKVQSLEEDRALRNKVLIGIVTFIGANLGALWAWIANRNPGG